MIGGTRNWDYRYTWLRDAAFTVYAFLRIGFRDEAAAFMSWIENYPAKHFDPKAPMPVLFTIQGDSPIAEQTLEHWEGYRGSGPVRIGNAAASQFQLDVYSELMDALYLSNKYVSPTSYDVWLKIRSRLEWICENWQLPDAGIWEMRNRQEHFVYSKVMNWVALDRGLRLADKRALPADRAKWIGERDKIYEEVMTKGWNEKCRAFTQYYGSEDLDASLLIMPWSSSWLQPIRGCSAPWRHSQTSAGWRTRQRQHGIPLSSETSHRWTAGRGRHFQHVLLLAGGGPDPRRPSFSR